jgi:hypothetical protein
MNPIKYSIEHTKEPGYDTIAVIDTLGRKKYLHSSVAPSREESLFTELLRDPGSKTVVVLGCGLGYHLKPLEKDNNSRVIIIDVLENIESLARSYIKFGGSASFISGNNLEMVEERLSEVLKLDEKTGFIICEHPPSLRLFHEFYSQCRQILDRVIRERVGNLVTKKKFGSIYVRNIAKNIAAFNTAYPFSSLIGCCKNHPAIIVSSSPSIDKSVRQLKKKAGNFVIFCVDSAYPILAAHNIRPDFIVTIDPQPWIAEHLLHCDPSIPFLQSAASWPLPENKNPRFLSLTSHPLCQVLDHFFPDIIGSFDSKTGTVAGDAVSAAQNMGCSPIFLAGTDLSFPDYSIYSKDSRYNTRFCNFLNSRINPVETLHMSYIQRSSQKTREEGIRTRHSFLQYRDKLNQLISHSQAKIFHVKVKGLSLRAAHAVAEIPDQISTKADVQLINMLSTLSTIGSLIDFTALKSLYTHTIVSEAVKEASGISDPDQEAAFIKIAFNKGVIR